MDLKSAAPGVSLWIEVCNLLDYQGNLTGMQRVVVSLLKEWLADPELPLRFCGFDRTSKVYHEVSRSELMQGLKQWTCESDPATLAPVPPPPACPVAEPEPVTRVSASDRVRAAVKKPLRVAFRLLPRRLQNVCRRLSGAARPVPAPEPLPPEPPARPAAPFRAGDLFLDFGMAWDVEAAEALAGLRRSARLRIILVMYDLIPIKTPQYCPTCAPPIYRAWLGHMLRASELFLAISENTRRDLLDVARQFGAASPLVEVVRLGDELVGGAASVRPRDLPAGSEGQFVLSVGTFEPRKNHYLLYNLWRRLAERHGSRTPLLVLAGREGWLSGDLLHLLRHDPLLSERLVILHDSTDAELNWLYENCRLTMYPSHYEGWGLPVNESLAHGKYCICSSSSSLPEIAGALPDYHDPLDLAGCLQLVERALFEPGFLEQKQEAIRGCYRVTPWKLCAGQILRVFQRRLNFSASRSIEAA